MHAVHDISTVKRVNLYVGAAALVVGCLMTAEFGRSMSWLHAASLCLLSVAAAFMWPMVDHLWRSNSRAIAGLLAILGVLFVGVEYFSHLGYTIGHRVRDTEETGVVNVNYKQAQEQVASEKENLKLWRDQLAKLQEQHAWAATVSADGLRAKLASHDKAIQLETARGGCKGKCLKLMEAKADTENKIALAEQASDLKKRIDATQRILDGKTTTAAKTEFKSSKIVNQTRFVSQLATLELEPDQAAFTWSQIFIGAMIALVTTFLAPVCFFIAFRDATYTKEQRTPVTAVRSPAAAAPPVHAAPSYAEQLAGLLDKARQPQFGLQSTSASLRDLARAQGLLTA
jgi:hypothetical protein